MTEEEEKEVDEVKYSVVVLARREVPISQKLGKTVYHILVSYVGGGLGPAMLRIPKEQYSLEAEKQTIRADIERRLLTPPESYEV